MRIIRWGIIGCGDVCEVKSGPAFYKCQGSALQAVMRRDSAKVADFAKRHHVPHWYTDATELIADKEVDAVYIATPPAQHMQYAIEALKAGKPVYVEKPMATSYAECLSMISAAEQSGQKLWVAYYRRAIPYFLKVKELLDKGEIGNVQSVNVRFFRAPSASDLNPENHVWRVKKDIAGGGYFYDMAPHTIDILQFLLGNFEQVNGTVSNTAGLYEVEDTVSASFRFASGVVGAGVWCYASNKIEEEDTIEIRGTKGVIRFSTFAFTPIELVNAETGGVIFSIAPPQHVQQPLIQAIVDELHGKGTCPSTAETAAHTSWVIDKIFGKI